MTTLLSLFLFLLLFPVASEAQTFCQNLGSIVICDGGRTTIAPLGPYGGVITQEDGQGHSSMTPYSILPAPDRKPTGVEPLRDLERLDSRRNRPEELRLPFDLEPGDGLLMYPE